MAQSEVLAVTGKVHRSHVMVFKPCLFLECRWCGTTAKHGGPELAKPCVRDMSREIQAS